MEGLAAYCTYDLGGRNVCCGCPLMHSDEELICKLESVLFDAGYNINFDFEMSCQTLRSSGCVPGGDDGRLDGSTWKLLAYVFYPRGQDKNCPDSD
jgi:hypothetical protein